MLHVFYSYLLNGRYTYIATVSHLAIHTYSNQMTKLLYVANNRHISLMYTVSKALECIVYDKVITFISNFISSTLQ